MLAALAVGASLLFAASAQAATTSYPGGGSGFDADAEGWTAGDAACEPLALLCTAEGVHDTGAGSPAGSISARTTLTVNLLNLFSGTATWTSPQFTVPVGSITGASVRLDRAFSAGALVGLDPTATYTVRLHDVTTGGDVEVMTEALTTADGSFAANIGPVALVGGHDYRLSIETTTDQGTLALSLIEGTTDVRFDNVALDVETLDQDGEDPGDTGGGGDGGADGSDGKDGADGDGSADGGSGKESTTSTRNITNRRLLALTRRGSPRRARMRGRRLVVPVRCPRRARRACRIVAQGYLSRRRPATNRRVVRVAPGRAFGGSSFACDRSSAASWRSASACSSARWFGPARRAPASSRRAG